MKKFSKRLIALLCAVWMCITLLPMEAAAVERLGELIAVIDRFGR